MVYFSKNKSSSKYHFLGLKIIKDPKSAGVLPSRAPSALRRVFDTKTTVLGENFQN